MTDTRDVIMLGRIGLKTLAYDRATGYVSLNLGHGRTIELTEEEAEALRDALRVVASECDEYRAGRLESPSWFER